MGSRLSKARDKLKNIRKFAARLLKRGTTSRSMVSHAQILISSLKLGPLKIRIKRTKDSDSDPGDEAEDHMTNLDVVSGTGTAGDTVTQRTFDGESEGGFDEEYEENDGMSATMHTAANTTVNNEEAAEGGTRLRRMLGARKSKERHKSSIASLAENIMDKFKGEYKTVDLFTYKVNKKTKMITTSSLLAHALDCHDAVTELNSELETLSELYTKQKLIAAKTAKGKIDPKIARLSVKSSKSVTFNKAEDILTPGTVLVGTIKIPTSETGRTVMDRDVADIHIYRNLDPTFRNLQQDLERPYELKIIRQLKNEVGETYWVGRHQTYDGRRDKQTVIIHAVVGQDKEVSVFYEDYETHCIGSLSNEEEKIMGTVLQMKRGQPGFFHKSLAHEHTFMVTRVEDGRAEQINEARYKLWQARAARALAFAAWTGAAAHASAIIKREMFNKRQVDWAEVVEDMVWIGDEVAAMMRRHVSLLDDLTFEDAAQRKAKFQDLASKGIARIRMHEAWEAATNLIQHIRDNTPKGSCHLVNAMNITNNFADRALARIEPCYERFDKSLRKAEKRVCLGLMKSWEQVYQPKLIRKIDSHSFSSSVQTMQMQNQEQEDLRKDIQEKIAKKKRTKRSQHYKSFATEKSGKTKDSDKFEASDDSEKTDENEAMCSICTDLFSNGSVMYVTTCKHAFHVDCLHDWFKEASMCPICRKDFSQYVD